ncbi:CapA family protein [bacterium]|nr:MAG: CapA family protein [bacterium]
MDGLKTRPYDAGDRDSPKIAKQFLGNPREVETKMPKSIKSILLITVGLLILSLAWHQKAVAPSPKVLSGNLPIANSVPRVTTLLAVGDIMLSRHVGAKIEKAGNPNLPFEDIKSLFDSTDIKFGNLECPLSDSKIPLLEGLVFRCLTKDASGLAWAGFNVLSTANNHAMDQGGKNIRFTIDYLKSQGISSVGTGGNLDEAWSPATPTLSPPILRSKTGGDEEGVPHFAFLAASYASANDNGKSKNDFVARIEDLPILQSAIKNLKSKNYIVIVSMHAGTEYTRHPNQQQIDFAHAAIDAGADIVIGHHPHWIQDIEIYPPSPSSPGEVGVPQKSQSDFKGVPEGRIPPQAGGEVENPHRGIIFYSLGNFVFDQMWSQDTREGLAVKLEFKNSALSTATLVPIIIDDYCCARLANGAEKTAILKKINLDSDIIKFQK